MLNLVIIFSARIPIALSWELVFYYSDNDLLVSWTPLKPSISQSLARMDAGDDQQYWKKLFILVLHCSDP